MNFSHSGVRPLISLMAGLGALFIAMSGIVLPGVGAAQQPVESVTNDPWPGVPWGEATNGLQLRISAGRNTESLTQSESLLYLGVQGRERF